MKDLFVRKLISLPGFSERLLKELVVLAPPLMKLKVADPPERNIAVWCGGALLASLPTFQSMWVSKQEYEEYGPTILRRKCF